MSARSRRSHADADRETRVSVAPGDELHLLQQLLALGGRFRDGRDADKLFRAALRLALDFFGASDGCIVSLPPGAVEAEVQFTLPRTGRWDRHELGRFIRREKVEIAPDVLVARLRRRGRTWGAMVVRAPDTDFRSTARRTLSKIAVTATDIAERIDVDRLREVRARIDRKIMEQLRPKDLFYQILHGIRSLIDYDHSAALLMCNHEGDTLEIVAEQISWRKGKSAGIGIEIPLTTDRRSALERGEVVGCARPDEAGRAGWTAWTDHDAIALAEMLCYTDAEDPPEAALLCAPLVTRDGLLGVLKVAACHADAFGPYEADLVSRFLPQASVALQNSRRTASLEAKMIAAERKHAMADLARGVSHDVNNALGAMLPLVQELRADADAGVIQDQVAAADLREIHTGLRVCLRIFRGMLDFARGAAHHTGTIPLHDEVAATLAILAEGMTRRTIEVVVDVPEDLPPIRGVRTDVERLLLNLMTNSRDAMPRGGRLTIAARRDGARVELTVTDTGTGIEPSELKRVQQPFYTTKRSGTGLGLAICRSIVSQMRGTLSLASTPGKGTRVTARLPIEEPGPEPTGLVRNDA